VEIPGGDPALHGTYWDALCRWDCGIFSLIARRGYDNIRETNFWPAYPVGVRWISLITHIPIEYVLLILPNLATLGAYLVLSRVYSLAEDERAARWALLAFAAFPFAYFHASGYPESMMVFFSALATLLAMRGRHVGAGFALGGAVLSRHLGILFGVSLLAAQIRQRGWRGFFKSPRFLTLALPFLLAGLHFTYCWQVWGDPLSWWRVRLDWGETAWWGAIQIVQHYERNPHFLSYLLWTMVPAAGVIALVIRRKTPELAAPALVMMVVILAVGAAGLGRYAASCWPAFLPWGVWLSKRPLLGASVVAAMGMAQGLFFFLHVHHYAIL
jgi:hypothetical protein